MSQKAVLKPYPVILDGDASGDLLSLETDVSTMDNVAYQISWTGDAEGEIRIEGSLTGTDWIALSFADEPIVVAPGESPILASLRGVPYSKLRVKYISTSGSGVMNAHITAKRLGG